MTTPTTRREMREAAAHERTPEPKRRAGRSRRGMLSEALLLCAAIAGAICIVLVILAFAANITLILFRTGSMAPTIPAGSVAIVQKVSATEIAVGDIVTVDRENELPVTHRVTSIAPGPSTASRTITMRGDANEDDDPLPYTVESVRIVHFSVPGLAPVIVALGNPFVLGGITVSAAALVGWAFWPRQPRRLLQNDGDG